MQQTQKSNPTTLNKDELISSYTDCEELLKKLITNVLKEINKLSQEIASLFREREHDKFLASVHSLKGIVSNVYAEKLIGLLQEIEALDLKGDSEQIAALLETLPAVALELEKDLVSVQQELNTVKT